MDNKRKIGRHHMAFYRAWLQGLNLGEMGDRYLETGIDLRKTKTTLLWMRDVIQQAAMRNGKHGMARLLRLRIRVAVGGVSEADPLPSLAEFRENFDPDGFYTEKELIQSYTEQYPQSADTKSRRRQSMIDRQLHALSWIEGLLATEPNQDDLVSAWFDHGIASRLMLAGIPNLRALTGHIRARGYRWWVTVPRLGEKGASRIVRWLKTYEETLGALPSHALQPIRSLPPARFEEARQPSTGIVPFSSLIIPGDLDGSQGANRDPNPQIDATHDMSAIQSWLNMKSSSRHSQRAYRKEAERLLLWAIIERRKALSDLNVDDCGAYRDWLSMLGRTEIDQWLFRIPQDQWINRASIGSLRCEDRWRPFKSPLSAQSVKYAIIVVSGLFEWLSSVNYLTFNPWKAVSKSIAQNKDEAPSLELTRAFTTGQWKYLSDHLSTTGSSPKAIRLRFAVHFAFITGMRESELASARVGRFYSMPLKEGLGSRWMLSVLGKGDKWRPIPIPDSTMELFSEYLVSRGLNSIPTDNPPDTPIIARQDGVNAIKESMIYNLFKECFKEVATKLAAEGHTLDARKFNSASTHWIRHTCGRHLASKGVQINKIQLLLGHASISTTSIYTRADEEDLWLEMNKIAEDHR